MDDTSSANRLMTEEPWRPDIITDGEIDTDTASFVVFLLILASPTMLIIAYGLQGLRGLAVVATVMVPLVFAIVAARHVDFARFFSFFLMCSRSPTAEGTDAAATLPAPFGFKSGDAVAVGWAQCVICLALLRVGDTVRQLPACGHLFHDQCVDRWLRAHATCPLCRAAVVVRRQDLPV